MSDTEYRAEQIAVVAREMARLDLVNVVRCRDCKHYTEDEAEYWHYCGEWCGQVDPDGFCSWSCRRSDKE